jgi:uncharacterized repeat protein (TIGR04138 family)
VSAAEDAVKQRLAEISRRDPRYTYEAYEFLFEALGHTQERLGRCVPETPEESAGPENHVSGPELVEGFLDLASKHFGRMARVVLHFWGIDATDDVGELVFNLIEAELLSKTDSDQRCDFHALCDLDQALTRGYEIVWEE